MKTLLPAFFPEPDEAFLNSQIRKTARIRKAMKPRISTAQFGKPQVEPQNQSGITTPASLHAPEPKPGVPSVGNVPMPWVTVLVGPARVAVTVVLELLQSVIVSVPV